MEMACMCLGVSGHGPKGAQTQSERLSRRLAHASPSSPRLSSTLPVHASCSPAAHWAAVWMKGISPSPSPSLSLSPTADDHFTAGNWNTGRLAEACHGSLAVSASLRPEKARRWTPRPPGGWLLMDTGRWLWWWKGWGCLVWL